MIGPLLQKDYSEIPIFRYTYPSVALHVQKPYTVYTRAPIISITGKNKTQIITKYITEYVHNTIINNN